MNGFRGGFGGGFGGANMGALMRQAQKMQEDMQKAKEELENSEFSGKASGGMVEAVLYGNKHIKSLTIKPEIVDPEDVEMLEDMVVAAVNDALAQIESFEKDNVPQIPGM